MTRHECFGDDLDAGRIAELEAEVCCPNRAAAANGFCRCGGWASEELRAIRDRAAQEAS
jgi:hypothetical protein